MVYHLLLANGARKLAQSVVGGAARSLLQDAGLQQGSDWVHHALQNRAARKEALGELYHRISAVREAYSQPPAVLPEDRTAEENLRARREFVDFIFRLRQVGGRKFKAPCQKLLTLYEDLLMLEDQKGPSAGSGSGQREQELRREIAASAQEIGDLIKKSLGL
ncbi:hypothetical protein [Oecophyllibacter saccharovorans]|uniref:hypothetical protein n=1 Tax=Oecophyllibacter saccharovorans TaxID=2558360 RepID=UPI00116E34A1|nr:hypothetical protein [Oecophyllibacter saccharovorans]TPW36409.1 hypothetical protein E3203_01075 [Oecophyllibacter saccharovorans]